MQTTMQPPASSSASVSCVRRANTCFRWMKFGMSMGITSACDAWTSSSPQQPDTAMDESDATWLMQRSTKRRLEKDADTPMDDSASGSGTRMVAETHAHNQVPSNWAKAAQTEWVAAGASGCFVCCECRGIHPFRVDEGPSCVDLKGRPCMCRKCGQAVCAACSGDHQCAQRSESSIDNAEPSPAQHTRIGPNGEILTPRGHILHDTNSFGRPPTLGGGDSWRFKDDDHMSMLSTTMHTPVIAEVLSHIECVMQPVANMWLKEW